MGEQRCVSKSGIAKCLQFSYNHFMFTLPIHLDVLNPLFCGDSHRNNEFTTDVGAVTCEQCKFNLNPTVDTLCTIGIGSDRYAAKVIEVRSPKHIVVKIDAFSLKDSMEFTRRKNGRWVVKDEPLRQASYRISFGHAEDYRDPSF
jgi:hypothetical protein